MVALSKSKKTALGKVVAPFSSGTRCGAPPLAATPIVVFDVPKSRPQAAMRRLALSGGLSPSRPAAASAGRLHTAIRRRMPAFPLFQTDLLHPALKRRLVGTPAQEARAVAEAAAGDVVVAYLDDEGRLYRLPFGRAC